MRPYRPLRSVATFLLLVATAPAVRAEESAADVAARGLEQCEEGRASSDRSTRESLFRSGQMLGERAVALDDNSADAHFAIVCNLGELMRLDGERISSVLELRRLLSELDRTLALNPDHVKAMATKGILLCRLPRLLGGDAVQGEQMLRRVVAEDPTAVNSRLVLAKQCASRGEHDEALQYASRALQIAREQGRADAVAEAQATLAQLGSAH
jgi:hypothetical protein